MFARMTKKGKLGMLIAFALVICVVVCSYAEVLMPEASGKKVQKDGKLLVDSSNSADGYIMVRTKKDNKRMKLRVTMGGSSITTSTLTAILRFSRFSSAGCPIR